MGDLLVFPSWRVLTRDEGKAPGNPRAIVDPQGKTLLVEEILRRRLIAVSDPQAPVRHEYLVRADGRLFELCLAEGAEDWQVLQV